MLRFVHTASAPMERPITSSGCRRLVPAMPVPFRLVLCLTPRSSAARVEQIIMVRRFHCRHLPATTSPLKERPTR